MKNLYQITLFTLLFMCACSSSGINWMSWEEANNNEPFNKKGLVWLYADWCTTSEFVADNVLSSPEIQNYINQNFYAINFNGETNAAINTSGREWDFIEQNNPQNTLSKGYHELALALTDLDADRFNKAVPYPRIIFLDEQMNRIVPVDGNLTEDELMTLLEFVAEDLFKTMTIDEYMQQKAIKRFKETQNKN